MNNYEQSWQDALEPYLKVLEQVMNEAAKPLGVVTAAAIVERSLSKASKSYPLLQIFKVSPKVIELDFSQFKPSQAPNEKAVGEACHFYTQRLEELITDLTGDILKPLLEKSFLDMYQLIEETYRYHAKV
jgi:hypothetical protein